jgi:beta-N-acetylhexosaminidase
MPRPQGPGDLSTRVFGGDPFWGGALGQAFIRGLHAGSDDGLAVVVKHFPGHGGADRDPDEEVPTVNKSLEQLEINELPPFFSVTGRAPDTASTADALLTAHIRFRGFQGDLRQSTNPVSLDPLALGQLLGLEPLKTWRDNGGLTVSDSLGAPAIKRFPAYAPFNNRRIARDAFNAGNDVLFLSEFDDDNPRLEQTGTIIDTLTHFTQQYQTQPDFAAKVEAAVTRILTLKLKLYGGQFDPEAALTDEAGLAALGQGAEDVRTLAQSAATLIFPTLAELNARQPQPPALEERLVIFTDVRAGQRLCLQCPAIARIDKRELERAIVDRYGPEKGSGEIRPTSLQSFTLEDLAIYLNQPAASAGEGTPTPEPSPVETALNQADWLVFNLLNPTPTVPNANVLTQFLARRPDLISGRKIIVFSYSAPYYLDATDLSKLTAFYALYSDSPAFVDVAAQLLFRELTPLGDSPVSVHSINYNLLEVTLPDPAQSILLVADKEQAQKGDTLLLTAGQIRDHNGHLVPDGTRVRFLAKFGDDLPALIGESLTAGGVATATFTLSRIGPVEISAESEPAFQSVKLQLNVQENESVITVIAPPTATPSVTPRPTTTASPTPSPTLTPSPTPSPTPTPEPINRVQDRDFFMMCLGLIAAMAAGYRLGALGNGDAPPTRRVRVALAGAIGALLGYNYFALGLPGADWAQVFGLFAATSWVVFGAMLGLGAGWYWFMRRASS